MEYKPWPLIILAFFHFIEPVSKVTFYSVFFSMNPLDIIAIEITEGSAWHVFEYFFLFPIAGIAIFSVKKWSFPVFIAVEILAFTSNLPYIQGIYDNQQYMLTTFFILFAVLNVTVVSYLLIPAVRVAYLDPKIRWWEAKPRYKIDAECSIGTDKPATVHNISESGVFIASQSELEIDSVINLQFRLEHPAVKLANDELNIQVEVIHHFTVDNQPGYGAKFIKNRKEDKRIIRKFILALDASDIQRRPPRLTINDLVEWFKTLVITGKGLIPSTTYQASNRVTK